MGHASGLNACLWGLDSSDTNVVMAILFSLNHCFEIFRKRREETLKAAFSVAFPTHMRIVVRRKYNFKVLQSDYLIIISTKLNDLKIKFNDYGF